MDDYASHLLTLVHAVQQPIGRPQFTAVSVRHENTGRDPVPLQTTPGRGHTDPTELAAITAWRRPDANDAYLLGALKVHGASTARIDLLAIWDDPVDDLSQPKWRTMHHAAPVDELPLPRVTDTYLDAPARLIRNLDTSATTIPSTTKSYSCAPAITRPGKIMALITRHRVTC